MKIYLEKKAPFMYIDWIKFKGTNGEEYEISPLTTDYGDDYVCATFEIMGTDIIGDEYGFSKCNALCEKLRGCCMVEAQLADYDGNEIHLDSSKAVFNYIERDSVKIDSEMPGATGFKYSDELKAKMYSLVNEYCSDQFGEQSEGEGCRFIGLAYTTVLLCDLFGDDDEEMGEVEVDVDFDTQTLELLTYMGPNKAVVIERIRYDTFEDALLNLFNSLCFDALTRVTEEQFSSFLEEWNELQEKEKYWREDIPCDEDLEARYYEEEYDDGSSIGCKDCPDDECTGHCMSCAYRPI